MRTCLGDLGHFGQAGHVAARDGGLELGVEADIAGVRKGEHGAVEGAGDAAEIVVRGGVGAVQADGHAGDAGGLECVDGLGGQQRGGAGRHVGAQADPDAVAHQVEQVGPLQRIAAGEDHQRLAEAADLVQQAVALLGGQFVRDGARIGPRRGSGRRPGRRPGSLPRSPAWGLDRSS